MSICKEYEDMILTDFIDGELDLGAQNRLIAHLKVCPACSALANEVKKNCVVPFEKTPREQVPGEIWRNIEAKIETKEENARGLEGFFTQLREMFFSPQYISALASVLIFVFVGMFLLQKQPVKQAQEKKQSPDVVYELGLLTTSPENENADLGTPIEKYFL